MVLGIYYLTQERPGSKGEGKAFKSVNEAILAYENQAITLQTKIVVRQKKTMPDGTVIQGNVHSTLGRLLFNEILPQDLGFVDRNHSRKRTPSGNRFPGRKEAVKADPGKSYQYPWRYQDRRGSG